jgi:fructan beta-fructosidase
MAVYDEHETYDRNIAFYTSTDLKQWTERSHVTGYFECPEIFELPVDDQTSTTRWVLFAADGRYAIGDFDGKTFKPAHEGKHRVHWGDYYASQTFDNAPDGRRIQIGWVRIAMPGMPFNQTFSFPHELSLRTTEEGVRLFAQPVEEIEELRRKKHVAESRGLTERSPVEQVVSGELFEVRAEFELGEASQVGLDIGGNRIAYDAAQRALHGASLKPINGRISIQVLVDRPLMEICGNRGRAFITTQRKVLGKVETISAFAEGGQARLIAFEVYELESIWKSHP